MTLKTIEKNNLFTSKIRVKTDIILGDCLTVLKEMPSESIDLIVTSPPYADQRKSTYGGISPDEYVEWFLPISGQLLRVLKRDGTFILNIKEKAMDGERHTYVMELVLQMRKQGWLWTEEFIWHKKTATRASGRIVSAMHGSVFCSSIKIRSSICIKMR